MNWDQASYNKFLIKKEVHIILYSYTLPINYSFLSYLSICLSYNLC